MPYVHLKDFEKFVRDRFKNIVTGNGSIIPRIAFKIALDDIFSRDIPMFAGQDEKRRCHVCKVKVGEKHLSFCSVGHNIFYP